MLSAAALLAAALVVHQAFAENDFEHDNGSRRPATLIASPDDAPKGSERLAGFLESEFGVRRQYAIRVLRALESARRGEVGDIHAVTGGLLGRLPSEDRRKALDGRLAAVRAAAAGDQALGGLVTWLQEARRHLLPAQKVTRGPASTAPRNEASFRAEIQQHPEITNRSTCFSMCQIVHSNWSLDDEPCTKACSISFTY